MFRIPIYYPEGISDSEKLMRTEGSGRIITKKMVEKGIGIGERMRLAYDLSLTEYILWKLRILK